MRNVYLFLLVGCAAPSADIPDQLSDPTQDTSAAFWGLQAHTLEVTLSPGADASLEEDPKTYVRADVVIDSACFCRTLPARR